MSERIWQNHDMTHEFKTKDHPEANGRKAKAGEQEYVATFPLEDGSFLRVRMGQEGFNNTTNLLTDMLTNAPSHDDGSIPK